MIILLIKFFFFVCDKMSVFSDICVSLYFGLTSGAYACLGGLGQIGWLMRIIKWCGLLKEKKKR